MRVDKWLNKSEETLNEAGINTSRLDCLVLLQDLIDKDKSYILAHPEWEIQPYDLEKLNQAIKSRAAFKPLSYIVGSSEFYRRKFIINDFVLQPRSESENIINLLRELPLPQKPLIADIGTGSGALIVTAALELPQSQNIATDIDHKCLAVAKRNALQYLAKIDFFQGDLLEPILANEFSVDVLLANLPYVPNKFIINKAATYEPRQAIYGGSDGLDLYRCFCHQLPPIKPRPKYILTESFPFQHESLVKLFLDAGYKLRTTSDFVQLFMKNSL